MRERSRTGLFLLELVLMLAVFAVCAAVCMQVFAFARIQSDQGRDLSNASLLAQSAAECWKRTEGDGAETARLLEGELTQGVVVVYRNDQWESCQGGEAAFALYLTPGAPADSGLAGISVDALDSGEALFALEVRAVTSHA